MTASRLAARSARSDRPTKFDENPTHLPRTAKAERLANMTKFEPEQLVTRKADNYHRWFGTDWGFIELCGAEHGNDWNAASEARLKKFVDYGHSLGYLVGFYAINGWTEQENQGWTAEFNFGTARAALLRWNAAIKAMPTSSRQINTKISPVRFARPAEAAPRCGLPGGSPPFRRVTEGGLQVPALGPARSQFALIAGADLTSLRPPHGRNLHNMTRLSPGKSPTAPKYPPNFSALGIRIGVNYICLFHDELITVVTIHSVCQI